MDALVSAYRRRVLEPLPTTSTCLVQLAAVLEQRVLLEVIALLEADRADVTDKRTIVGVCADVVLVVGRVGEDLATHFARPLVLGTRHGAVQCRRMHRPRRTSSAAVKCRVDVEVLGRASSAKVKSRVDVEVLGRASSAAMKCSVDVEVLGRASSAEVKSRVDVEVLGRASSAEVKCLSLIHI